MKLKWFIFIFLNLFSLMVFQSCGNHINTPSAPPPVNTDTTTFTFSPIVTGTATAIFTITSTLTNNGTFPPTNTFTPSYTSTPESPTVTDTATFTPTITPTYIPTYTLTPTPTGCYGTLPVTQFNLPNPIPNATLFWTPAVGTPTMTTMGIFVNSSYNTVILKSQSDWNTYWADLNFPAPAAPTDFSTTMVLIPGTNSGILIYTFDQVCYTGTNVVVYQTLISNGVPPTPLPTDTPIPTGTVTPIETPIPTPSILPHWFYLIPSSDLPVSFVSHFIFGA